MDKIIRLEKVSFAYPEREEVLKNISFSVNKSEIVLIIGSSGSGKTTLLRLLKKHMVPAGKIDGKIYCLDKEIELLTDRQAAQKIGYVQQNIENQIVTDKVFSELAFGLENLGEANMAIHRKTAEIAEYFGITDIMDKPTSSLSGGQKQLINLASVMVMQPDILLLDEPTAQLDPITAEKFIDILFRINQDFGTTILLTEHHLENIYSRVDRVIALEHGRLVCDDTPRQAAKCMAVDYPQLQAGLPSYVELYSLLSDKYGQAFTRQYDCPWSVKEARNMLEHLAAPKKINMDKKAAISGDIAVAVKDLEFAYGKNSKYVVENLSLNVDKSKIFAILGGNGAGKSTLLKLMANILKPSSGKIKCMGQAAYMPQNPQAFFTEITVEEELASVVWLGAKAQKISRQQMIEEVEKMLEDMDLQEVRKNHPYDISGGQQQKLAIAKVLLTKPEILLLDEPTKGLDGYFKKNLGEMLRKLTLQGLTIILVSHDVEFCGKYADKCGLLYRGNFAACEDTRSFFAGNRFYTTQINKIAGGVLPGVITCEEAAREVCL